MAEQPPARRGFLQALGLAGATAAAGQAAAAEAPRADQVPAGRAHKESADERRRARYQPDSAHVQAFYRTNRY